MDEHVVITVRCDDAPPLSKAPSYRILGYSALMLRSFLICFIAGIRIQWANQSAFDNNNVFTSTSTVASYGVLVIYFVLIVGPEEVTEDYKDYANLLKFIGCCLAFLGPFSLLMVIVLPPKLNWLGYLVTCVMLGIIVTCFYVDDQQEFKPYLYNDMALLFVPIFTLATTLFTARSLNWVMYWVIYVCLRMENGYHLISYVMFIYVKTRKLGARSSRVMMMIRQEEYDIGHPPYLSYMMPLRNPPSF